MQLEAGGRRRREDHEVGALDRGPGRRPRRRSITPSATAARDPAPDGLHAAIVQSTADSGRGAQGARDRARDQTEAEERAIRERAARRRVRRPGQSCPAGRCPTTRAVSAPPPRRSIASRPVAHPPLAAPSAPAGPGRRRGFWRRIDRCAARCRAARRGGTRRSAGSAAPRRRAPRAARRCRSGGRRTSRRVWASASDQTFGRPASAASTFSSGYS